MWANFASEPETKYKSSVLTHWFCHDVCCLVAARPAGFCFSCDLNRSASNVSANPSLLLAWTTHCSASILRFDFLQTHAFRHVCSKSCATNNIHIWNTVEIFIQNTRTLQVFTEHHWLLVVAYCPLVKMLCCLSQICKMWVCYSYYYSSYYQQCFDNVGLATLECFLVCEIF